MADEEEPKTGETGSTLADVTAEEGSGLFSAVMAEMSRRSPSPPKEETAKVEDKEGESKKEEEPAGKEEESTGGLPGGDPLGDPVPTTEEITPAEVLDQGPPSPPPSPSKEESTKEEESEGVVVEKEGGEGEDKPASEDVGEGGEASKEEEGESGDVKEDDKEDKKDGTPPAEEKESEEVTKKDDKKERKSRKSIIVPHLLSDEEIMAKGVSELEIENYRKFYLRQAFSLHKWHESVKDHTFPTEFISLTFDEVDALLASSHLPSEDTPTITDTQKRILDELKEKLDAAIAKYGEEGAFVKLNAKMPADAILEKNNGDYLQSIQEGVMTEMEIENQFTNAYLIWRSWRSSSFRETETRPRADNVLRRSFRRIQRSFRPTSTPAGRQRSKSADGAVPLAEDTPKDEEKKEEENKDDTPPAEATPTDETVPTTGEDTSAPITVEATVETAPTLEAQPTAVNDQVTDAVTQSNLELGEAPAPETEPQTTETEPKATETEPQTELQTTESEPPATETKAQTTETEPKATETEPEATETEPEIQPAEATPAADEKEGKEAEEAAPKSKPRSLLKKKSEGDSSEEHQMLKVKKETLQNKILRAYMKTMFKQYRVTNGTEALNLLTTSTIVKEELQIVKTFEKIEGTEAVLSIVKWSPSEMPTYPGMNFRAFVYNNTLTAVTQHDDILYVPNIARFKDTILRKMQTFFDEVLKSALESEENYIFDIFVAPNKIYLTGLHPFHHTTGACLFTWRQSLKVLMDGPLELRHLHTPFKKCFSGLLPHWQNICDTVTQQKREEDHNQSKNCVIL